MEKKQTAVEWLINELDLSNDTFTMKIINQAKLMEENQSKKDFMAGLEVSIQEAYRVAQKSWGKEYKTEQYYNETYKSK